MSGPTANLSPRTLRIVILENEPQLADLYELCIRDWFKHADVVKFENGNDAWRELSQTSPDMFVMDWTHPGLSGHELLRHLAANKAGYVVLLTSEYFAEDLSSLSGLGLKVGYLPKPFGIVQFWRALNEYLGPSDFPERQDILLRSELA